MLSSLRKATGLASESTDLIRQRLLEAEPATFASLLENAARAEELARPGTRIYYRIVADPEDGIVVDVTRQRHRGGRFSFNALGPFADAEAARRAIPAAAERVENPDGVILPGGTISQWKLFVPEPRWRACVRRFLSAFRRR